MAASHSNNIMENKVNLYRFVCYKCSDYEDQLKEIINELSSAETIIKILQKELRSTRTIDNTCTRNQIVAEGPDKKPITKEWALIFPKNNTEKLQTSDKRKKNEFTTSNQPITTANRFTLLANLEEDNTEFTEFQNYSEQTQMHKIYKSTKQQTTGQKIPTLVNGQTQHTDNVKLPTSNNKNNFQTQKTNRVNKLKEHSKCSKHASQKQPKVVILGDSHARGCPAQ